MKRWIAVLLCLCLAVSFTACGLVKEETEESKMQAYEDFQALVASQALVAVDMGLYADEDGKKALITNIKNGMSGDVEVTDLIVAFTAWDALGIPLQIKTEQTPDSTFYCIEMTGLNISVENGGTWEANKALFLSENCKEITYVQAIPVSGVINGKKWENPCYQQWKTYFMDKMLTAWMEADMADQLVRDEITANTDPEDDTDGPDTSMPFSEFYSYLLSQEVVALDANAHLQEDGSNALMADVKNNAVSDATDITIAYAMWDSEGNPILIRRETGEDSGSYIKVVGYGDLMVEGLETWDADKGYYVANDHDTIDHVEAILVSCKLNGTVWENPMYELWQLHFGGQKLESEVLDEIRSLTEADEA